MSQRYTPTKLGEPIFDNVTGPLLMTEEGAFVAHEYNTLLMAAEFETASAEAVVLPWVLIKGLSGGDAADLWMPLLTITLTAGSAAPAIDPVTPSWFKAPAAQSEIPNCHKVRLELISVSADNVRLWAGLLNRAPR